MSLLLSILFALHLLLPSAMIPQSVSFSGSVATGNTFTFVSQTGAAGALFCSGSTSCSLTIPSTGTSQLMELAGESTSSNYITAVSGAGTWSVPGGCTFGISGSNVSCSHNLSSTSGVTTLSLTLNNTTAMRFYLMVYSYTPGPISLDTCGTANPAISGGVNNGVALTLTGTSDVIIQWEIDGPTGITTYGHFSTTNSDIAVADLINTSSGVAPTWSTATTSYSPPEAACAFK